MFSEDYSLVFAEKMKIAAVGAHLGQEQITQRKLQ